MSNRRKVTSVSAEQIPQSIAPWDQSNHLFLQPQMQTAFLTGMITLPGTTDRAIIATMRNPGATMTAVLTKEETRQWARMLWEAANEIPGGLVLPDPPEARGINPGKNGHGGE